MLLCLVHCHAWGPRMQWAGAGVHSAKAEECTTPRIGSRNIKINIGGGGLPRNQK